MTVCPRCGHVEDSGAFCTECGAPLDAGNQSDATVAGGLDDLRAVSDPTMGDGAMPFFGQAPRQAPSQASGQIPGAAPGQPAPGRPMPGQPMFAQPAFAQPPVPQGTPGGTTTKHGMSAAMIAAIIAVIALVLGGGGLFVTHQMRLWGNVTVPDYTAWTVSGGEGITAEEAAQRLESDGFTVVIQRQYSNEDEGIFIGVSGIDPGAKLKAGSSLTVLESKGPRAESSDSGSSSGGSKSKNSTTTKTPKITSKQLETIADRYSSSDVAVSAMAIGGSASKSGSSSSASPATTQQGHRQFEAAGLYLPVYLAAQDRGGEAQSLATTMMSGMDNNAGNNAVAAMGGWSAVNSWLSDNDYSDSSFNRNFGDVAASQAGYQNTSSSADTVRMLAAVDAAGGTSLMNVDIASEGVSIPSGMTVHAHRGMGIQNTWNYFAIVESNGHKAAVSVVTQNQGKERAAELMSEVLSSVDDSLSK